MEGNGQAKGLRRTLAVIAFLIPFSFAMRAIDWPAGQHPDEIGILRYMTDMVEDRYTHEAKNSVYPEGFLVLSNIHRHALKVDRWLAQRRDREGVLHRDIDFIRAPRNTELMPNVFIGRHTNAILAGLCGLFLFLAIHAATGSMAGGLCAVALASCTPFMVEHAHYCETDISYCACLALALWFLFAALKRSSMGWLVAGAAASAAAFACKYTAAPIIPFCILVYVDMCVRWLRDASSSGERNRRIRRCVVAALMCLAAAVAAYAALTPTFYTYPGWYWKRIFNIYGEAHGETSAAELSSTPEHVPFLKYRYILRLLMGYFRVVGPIHLILAAASAVLLLSRRRKNPCGPWLLALVVLFFIVDLFCAPWIRSQEFIPFAVLIGAVIAMAAGELHAMAMASHWLAIRISVPLLCVVACGLLAYGDAHRASMMFATEDCRSAMRHWLEMSSNPETRFAAGRFAYWAIKYGRVNTAEVFGEAESFWDPTSATTNAPAHEYFVRQTAIPARGFISNVTGQRHPHFQNGWTNFLAHATLLREWKLTPGYQTEFVQLPMELWGIIPDDTVRVRPSPLSARPTAFRMGPEYYDAAQSGDFLGPIDAIRTVGARKLVRFVPPPDGRPLYAVTRHVEGGIPARINWEGCFSPREKIIEPGRADWFIYKPGLFDGFGDIYVRTRVRMRGDDQTSLCLTTITSDPAFAAELLTRGGSPDKAAELLAQAKLPEDLGQAFAEAVPPIPDRFYNDFARVRFGDLTIYPAGGFIPTDPSKSLEPRNVWLDSEFPVMFDPGRYIVSFRISPEQSLTQEIQSISFSKAASQRVFSRHGFAPGDELEIEVVFDRPTYPRIRGDVTAIGTATPVAKLQDFTITWVPDLSPAK